MSGTFTLTSTLKTEYTIVSNAFIDHYLAQANGSYVKVYLYLLRLLSSDPSEVAIALIADRLEETEKDIERALKYWEKQKLVRLERDSSGSLTGVSLLAPQTPMPSSLPAVETAPGTAPVVESSPLIVENSPPMAEKSSPAAENSSPTAENSSPAAENPLPIAKNSPPIAENDKKAMMPPAKKVSGKEAHFEKPNYSSAQIAELTALPDVQRIVASTEQNLGRLLKPADEQLILYLYESVGLSADLIIYLFEYCAGQNKKSCSYIEAVALAWAEEGIDTIEKAEASTAAYNSNYNAVNRAFGLNRIPGNIEKQYIQRWFHTWGFDIPIVEEACNRTMLAISKPDFKYANSILERWYKAGVKRKEDIAPLDEEFAKQNAAKEAARRSQDAQGTANTTGNNRFNSFPQREYTASDFSSMEEKLLGNNKPK